MLQEFSKIWRGCEQVRLQRENSIVSKKIIFFISRGKKQGGLCQLYVKGSILNLQKTP